MIELTGRVTHDGETYEPGETINKIKKDEAQRLVNLGVAFFNGKNGGPNNENQDKVEDTQDEVNYEEELDLLDYGDLKIVAKEVGLDFKGNISKKDLIALIIEENKAEAILEFTEVEE